MTDIKYKKDFALYRVIGSKIHAERKRLGYSLAELAEKCNIEQYQTVSKWEKGDTAPPIDKLLILCNIFKCDMDYLLGKIPHRTKAVTDFVEATGLSPDAVYTLTRHAELKTPYSFVVKEFITEQLEDSSFLFEIFKTLDALINMDSGNLSDSISTEDYDGGILTVPGEVSEFLEFRLQQTMLDFVRKFHSSFREEET